MERLADYNLSDAVVRRVEKGSIAEDLGILPGDRLLAINDAAVPDVFDYELRILVEELQLLVAGPEGELTVYEIQKDADEDLGLHFENPLLAGCESCTNRCVFCFIDQLPKGMRPSLYFKDDDSRLSFLTGNYITLTNMSDAEIERIARMRLSPLNISVHSTNPKLRRRLLGHKDAGQLMDRLKIFAKAGIALNTQFVLCPGLNDGAALEESWTELLEGLGEALQSVAVVPVGLTRFRERLYPLRPYQQEEAKAVVEQVRHYQKEALQARGQRIIFASDEFYLLAGEALPPLADYEGFPQLENGVGMLRLFQTDLEKGLKQRPDATEAKVLWEKLPQEALPFTGRVLIPTGCLAAPMMQAKQEACEAWSGLRLDILAVENTFFGPTITVTGLLTGQDLKEALAKRLAPGDVVLLCSSMLRQEDDVFLDDYRLQDLAEALGAPVYACAQEGTAYLAALAYLSKAFVPEGCMA